MAVVINEFEVLPAEPVARRPESSNDAAPPTKEPLDPGELDDALRRLHTQALRVWSH